MADSGDTKSNKKGTFLIIFAALALAGGVYLWRSNAANQMPSLSIQRYGDGGYLFKINDKPFLIKGFCYNPIPAGKDFEYDFWSDPGKPWLTDGKLMKEAGVNAVRIYRTGKHPKLTKQGIGDLYHKFGIRTFVGHYLGFWDWPQANYADAAFREKMAVDVLNVVREYKSEPGIIGWILGNENNYSFDRNVRVWSNDEIDKLGDSQKIWEARARIYYSFVNDLAKEVKKIDPTRPVIMGIGEIKSLQIAAQETPDVDVLGVIAYRGASFGNLFRQVKQIYDKPVLLTEFGADRFNAYTREEDPQSQSRFVEYQWKDIERNSVAKTGSGNAIGGLVFEWTDEWWKGNESLAHTWGIHDQAAQWSHSAYYYDYEAPGRMNINEEWWGVVSIKPRPQDLKNAIDKREPTQTYRMLKSLWNQETSVVPDTGTKALASPKSSEPAGPAEKASVPAVEKTPAPPAASSASSESSAPSGLVLVSNAAGGYTWTRNGIPFWVKGVVYGTGPIGDASAVSFWSNPNRPWVNDADMMKQAGINAIRLYVTADEVSGAILGVRDFASRDVHTFMGHDLGFWSRPLTDYRDEAVRAAIASEVLQMVEAGKNESGILGWILGNENNSAFESAAIPDQASRAEIYFSFVNELAAQIKKIDPLRPVIMGLGETEFVDLAAKLTPHVDAVGLIAYRGDTFGGLFTEYSKKITKPIVALEYGADSFNAHTGQPDEAAQARYLQSLWTDIRNHSTLETASGPVVGGFLYEWVDQWWRADANDPSSWSVQNQEAQWSSAAYTYDYDAPEHLNVNEEWFGVMKRIPDPRTPGASILAPKQALAALTPLWKQPGTLSPETMGLPDDAR